MVELSCGDCPSIGLISDQVIPCELRYLLALHARRHRLWIALLAQRDELIVFYALLPSLVQPGRGGSLVANILSRGYRQL